MERVPEEEQLYIHTARGCKHPLVTFKADGDLHNCLHCGEYTRQFLPSDQRIRGCLGEDVADDPPRANRKHTSTPTIYEKPVTRQATRNHKRGAESGDTSLAMFSLEDGWMTARRPPKMSYAHSL